MKRIIFPRGFLIGIILALGLLVLGGCEATQPIDEAALETSLEIVNQAIAEGKLVSCFVGLNEEGEVKKNLVLKEDGCPTFNTEEELEGFCVGEVTGVAKCNGYVKVISGEEAIYYNSAGEVVSEVGEGECAVSVECGVEAAGVDTESEEVTGEEMTEGEEVEGESALSADEEGEEGEGEGEETEGDEGVEGEESEEGEGEEEEE